MFKKLANFTLRDLRSMFMAGIVRFHIKVHYLFQFYVVWILRLINFTIELIDYMLLLYLQGVTINKDMDFI